MVVNPLLPKIIPKIIRKKEVEHDLEVGVTLLTPVAVAVVVIPVTPVTPVTPVDPVVHPPLPEMVMAVVAAKTIQDGELQ